MKNLLVAVSLTLAAVSAHANVVSGGLEITGESLFNLTLSDAGWGSIEGIPEGYYTAGMTGTMQARKDGIFTATYLGQAATYANRYVGLDGGRAVKGYTNPINGIRNTASVYAAAGSVVDFSFGQDNNGDGVFDQSVFANGMVNQASRGIAFFANSFGLLDNRGYLFDFLIGYNDSASADRDFDDYVVGVRHVPAPAALPLLATALGMFGLSRRKSKVKA
jgi:hypothetical protein